MKIQPIYKTMVKDQVTKAWLNHIFLMSHNYGFGWSQLISGQGGSGKDFSALKMMELLTTRPIEDRNIAFGAEQYLDSLDNAKIGDVLLWSEVGVGFSSRNWNSISNKLIGQVVQTMRIKRVIVFMTTPDLSFLDVQGRKMIFCHSEVIRHADNPPKMWIYRISVDRKTGNIYHIHPLIRIGESIIKLRSIVFNSLPSQYLIDMFNEKQMKYKGMVEKSARNMIKMMEKSEGGNQSIEQNIFEIVEKVKKNPSLYFNRHDRLDEDIISAYEHIPKNRAESVKKLVELEIKTKKSVGRGV